MILSPAKFSDLFPDRRVRYRPLDSEQWLHWQVISSAILEMIADSQSQSGLQELIQITSSETE